VASVALAGLVLAAWTWRAWPDPLIDFGREAYVAWRLAAGDVLHRDIVYVSGPLSPYWNALLFRVFGVGLETLFTANALVLVGLLAVWQRLLRAVADPLAAWAGSLVFVSLFAFAQYVGIGNYNYIAPYSHELTHGLLLASAGLLAWVWILRDGRPVAWTLAGLALGAVALTKVEMLAAAAAANAIGVVALLRQQRMAPRSLAAGLGAFALGALASIAVAVAALAGGLGIPGAVRAVAIGAIRLFGDDLAALPFYQRGMGVDDPLGNGATALLWAARIGGLFAPAALLALAARGDRLQGRWLPTGVFVATAAALVPFVRDVPWLEAARPLPFFGLVALVYSATRMARPTDPERATRRILQSILVTFATVLLAKIFLMARIYQYGFVLALPAVLLFVTALVSWIPNEIGRRGGSAPIFRASALGVIAIAILGHLLLMAPHVSVRTGRLGDGHDAIRVPPGLARSVGGAVRAVRNNSRTNDRLLVLPEGVMLNYLARRRTPTPHFSFNPFELHVYGEDEILEGLTRTPPALVVLVHHDTSEHGARFLGRDYGRRLMRWIRGRYEIVQQWGDAPLQPAARFGVAVLRPRPEAESAKVGARN
jgi:hypothetical protein